MNGTLLWPIVFWGWAPDDCPPGSIRLALLFFLRWTLLITCPKGWSCTPRGVHFGTDTRDMSLPNASSETKPSPLLYTSSPCSHCTTKVYRGAQGRCLWTRLTHTGLGAKLEPATLEGSGHSSLYLVMVSPRCNILQRIIIIIICYCFIFIFLIILW